MKYEKYMLIFTFYMIFYSYKNTFGAKTNFCLSRGGNGAAVRALEKFVSTLAQSYQVLVSWLSE
jgi:hypothetical protein